MPCRTEIESCSVGLRRGDVHDYNGLAPRRPTDAATRFPSGENLTAYTAAALVAAATVPPVLPERLSSHLLCSLPRVAVLLTAARATTSRTTRLRLLTSHLLTFDLYANALAGAKRRYRKLDSGGPVATAIPRQDRVRVCTVLGERHFARPRRTS